MSYHRKQNVMQPMGLGLDVGGAIVTAASALQDPYLQEAICHVSQLSAINGRLPVPVCVQSNAPATTAGIGLRKVMPLMRAYVYAEQNPWAYGVGVSVIVGVPMLLGYLIGKGR